jgi:signal transduction histidine kinase
VKTWRPAALPVALIWLAAVGLLDLLTPPDVDFTELYLVPVAVVAWFYGWRYAVAMALLVTLTEVLVDSGVLRPADAGSSTMVATIAWNALSDFLAYGIVAAVVDRVHVERERSRSVSADRARLLRLLEREFARPLRSIDWFARTFEERFTVEIERADKVREHFAGLRHHVREVTFLATDLIRIGHLDSGQLSFAPGPVDLKVVAGAAASQVLDRSRVIFSASPEELTVWADAEPLHHAIAAVIGRLIEMAPPYEVVHLFARGSANEAVVEFTSRAAAIAPDAFELADLLTRANGGRLVVIPRDGEAGVRVNLYVPRSQRPLSDPGVAATTISV